MPWQDFFKLTVTKSARHGEEFFYAAKLKTPEEFKVNDLFIHRFEHLRLNPIEKKKLSLDLRKILVCHHLFESQQFKKICRDFKAHILACEQHEMAFSTQGGGIYLFLAIMNDPKLKHKKITCYTSELPLPLAGFASEHHIQFIFRPHATSYLSDFSTLWKESELMKLFELKDFKASA